MLTKEEEMIKETEDIFAIADEHQQSSGRIEDH